MFYTRLKDKQSKMNTSDVIYYIPCYSSYLEHIGITFQRLKSILSRHKSNVIINPLVKLLQIIVININYFPKFEEVKVLDSENFNKRTFLKMFCIQSNELQERF